MPCDRPADAPSAPRRDHGSRLALALAAAALLFAAAGCRSSADAELQAALDATWRAHPESVGLMLHVEAPSLGISWSGAAGYTDPAHTAPLTPNRPGRIGSITKTFVAAAIVRLVEQGRLRLDTPLTDVLPERTRLLMLAHGYELDRITVGHLLSHKGGLPCHSDSAKWRDKTAAGENATYRWTRDEQIREAITQLDKEAPGARWHYSDTNYCLLTEILEQVTGRAFPLAMRQLLAYQRLGLEQTWFWTLEPDPPGAGELVVQAVRHVGVDTAHDSPTWGQFGQAGIVSTPRDLARFAQALFAGEVFDDPASAALLLRDIPTADGKQVEERPAEHIALDYYMGVENLRAPGIDAYGHHGFWGTWVAWFPACDASIALFSLDADVIHDFELDLVREVFAVLRVRGAAPVPVPEPEPQ